MSYCHTTITSIRSQKKLLAQHTHIIACKCLTVVILTNTHNLSSCLYISKAMIANNDSTPPTISIIGGGLGGVVLAIGLLQHHIPFHIYESAPSFGEIGAGVAFGPNSVRALGLIAPGLLRAYVRHATTNESSDLADTFLSFRRGTSQGGFAGEHLFNLRGGETARKVTGMPTRCCVHRAHFLDEIVKILPKECVSFGKTLAKIDEIATDELVLHFADGSTATASAVVGCDGIRSPTRKHIHETQGHPKFSGEYAYRALVPREIFKKSMGVERTVNGQVYVGSGGYMITYPVEHGTNINMVAVCCRPTSSWKHETWVAPSTEEDLKQDFEGWDEELVGLLTKYGTRDRWALFDNLHTDPYFRGRICLLGDSAHATTPHLGAGAGMAMEDAYVLSHLLKDIADPQDITEAFAKYDAIRRPSSQELVRLSRLSGLTYAFLDESIGSDVVKMETEFAKRYNWLWEEDLQQNLAQLSA
jgi:salicylate hydroxylase